MPTKIIAEEGCVDSYQNEYLRYGKTCLIITSKTAAKKSGALDDVIRAIKDKIHYLIFDEIMENPSLEILEKAKKLYGKEKIDFIIGIGGGSVLDAAKMIGVLLKNPQADTEMLLKNEELYSLPLVAIPTTAGTGSETTPYAVMTDHTIQNKVTCKPKIFPDIALLDVRYYMSMPESVLYSTALDAMCHLSEGYLVKRAQVFSDELAKIGLKYFCKAKDDLYQACVTKETYENLMLASTIAGMVISHTGTGIPHGMGYPLTYYHGVYHGKATALFLPALIKLHREKDHPGREKGEKLLRLLGFYDENSLKRFIETLVGGFQISNENLLKYTLEMSNNKKKLSSHDFEITYDDLYEAYSDSLDLNDSLDR